MSTNDDAMALLLRPVRHAVNNLSMVLSANLDAALPKLPPGDRATAQVVRARQAAEDYDRLIRGYFALGRHETVKPMAAARYLRDLLPLFVLAAGGPLPLEVEGEAMVEVRSPTLDAALVLAAAGASDRPPGERPALRISGATVTFAWPISDAAREALTAAGARVEAASAGATGVTLPGPAAAVASSG
ncbi:hypothetical protein ACE7GA_12390 [Roseomonas sp. CCTCC AB2023176]|uniref:hypothetical protein n=1 Tax=Roseomonas sp. CCTCC AB2023176 TaxID=3342640 RepID=UPI0035E1440F